MRIKAAVAMLAGMLAAITLTSCTFIPNDISELESPPKLSAEQQDIESALEQSVNKLTHRYPLEGKYRGAFVLKDLDHDGSKEALAFYSNGSTGPQIAMLSKIRGKWKIIRTIRNEATEIDTVEFGDFNGDGHEDIAVGWRSLSLTLFVYLSDGTKYKKVKLCDYNKMLTLDMNGDGKTDILTLSNLDAKPTKANLISYKDGKLFVASSAPLDGTVTGFAGIYKTKLSAKSNQNIVLIDGSKSANRMITEVLCVKNNRIISPFYNAKSKTVTSTERDSASYKCMDIDKDGIIEIPKLTALPTKLNKKKTNQNWLVNWSQFTGSNTLKPKIQTLINYTEDYYFKYPEKWHGKVTVANHLNGSVWDFCKWDSVKKSYGKVLFTIFAYNMDQLGNIIGKTSYHILAKSKNTVYMVKINDGTAKDKFALSLSQIKSDFSLFN